MKYRVAFYKNGAFIYCEECMKLHEFKQDMIYADVSAESEEQAIEIAKERIRKATDNHLTMPEFEMEDKPLCPAGLIFKAYCKQGKGEEE